MCKLFLITEIEDQTKAELFARAAIPHITKTDNHGLGIMRLGEQGIHIQRWLHPGSINRRETHYLKKYESALACQRNTEGTRPKELKAIAIHGRFATCDKSLRNTHPFMRDGVALMHNGIISNASEYKREVSDCDSEALLTQYIDHRVSESEPQDIGETLGHAMDGVGGYYAAIVFNESGSVDVWRDNQATLCLAHVRGIGIVVSTTQEIIKRTAKALRTKIDGIDDILPYTVIRWPAQGNPIISQYTAAKPVTVPTKTYDTWRANKLMQPQETRIKELFDESESDSKITIPSIPDYDDYEGWRGHTGGR